MIATAVLCTLLVANLVICLCKYSSSTVHSVVFVSFSLNLLFSVGITFIYNLELLKVYFALEYLFPHFLLEFN